MANRVVILVGATLDGLDGTTNGDVLTWSSSTSSWSAQPAGSGSSPYDLSGETADTVSTSDVIFHFIAVHAQINTEFQIITHHVTHRQKSVGILKRIKI